MDGTLTGTTTLGQSGPGSNCNGGVLCILEGYKIEALPSDCLISYPGSSLEVVLPLCRDAVGIF